MRFNLLSHEAVQLSAGWRACLLGERSHFPIVMLNLFQDNPMQRAVMLKQVQHDENWKSLT